MQMQGKPYLKSPCTVFCFQHCAGGGDELVGAHFVLGLAGTAGALLCPTRWRRLAISLRCALLSALAGRPAAGPGGSGPLGPTCCFLLAWRRLLGGISIGLAASCGVS